MDGRMGEVKGRRVHAYAATTVTRLHSTEIYALVYVRWSATTLTGRERRRHKHAQQTHGKRTASPLLSKTRRRRSNCSLANVHVPVESSTIGPHSPQTPQLLSSIALLYLLAAHSTKREQHGLALDHRPAEKPLSQSGTARPSVSVWRRR